MKEYVLQRERNGVVEYLVHVYGEDYQFKVKVTTDINEVTPISRGFLATTLKLLVHTGEYFEVREVTE